MLRRLRIAALLLPLVACCLGQTDLSAALAAAKRSDDQREPLQRASDILAALSLNPGDSAADVGAGGGYYTARLSALVGPQGRVFAVEIRESSLDLLRYRAQVDSLGNVVVTRGDADNPHLPENSLDAVLIVDAYHEMPQYRAMLDQICKALKPSGRLVIADYSLRSARGDPRDSQTKRHILSPDLVRAELRQAGFEIDKLSDPLQEQKPGNQNGRISQGDLWLLLAHRNTP